ncbi:GFA family protein [Paraburkholderia sprentiae WSM5005]|uniref:GFA family protein n=1 Tax=Paraburkholderia sprentiae WSM5005 TaxID=754502 RepID=A0A1I9YFK6_9BURK|nr:GFA family protein [Paraburkholderia sprentiae]APA85089.1 GFA family protein [Paraburkholderia sprentiae WSM5005]
MLRTYLGSCHCQLVKFEARIDFDEGTSKCNCSYCSRLRFWHVQVRREDFRLLCDEAVLNEYQGNNLVAHHPFCKRCGVHVFDRIDMPNGTGYPYINVNIMCLDELDLDAALNAPVTYRDGLHNDWGNPPVQTRHL